MKKLPLSILFSLLAFTTCLAQLPPLFENTPKKIQQPKILATYPKNTFLENITEGSDGNLYITNYPEGKVVQVKSDGTTTDYAVINGKIAGIANYKKDEFLVTGWDVSGVPSIFLIGADKQTSLFTTIPGGMFPNGITKLSGDLYLIADSFAGCLWLLDAGKKSIEVWIKNELLARSSDKVQIPAANGVKVHHGYVFVSNSEKNQLIRIPVSNNKPGKPDIYLEHVFIDDFQFDADGNIYAATNIYNSVLKITPSKAVTLLATLEQGAAGATSVLLRKEKSGKTVMYVPTCGGMGVPPPSGIEDAKLLVFTLN